MIYLVIPELEVSETADELASSWEKPKKPPPTPPNEPEIDAPRAAGTKEKCVVLNPFALNPPIANH